MARMMSLLSEFRIGAISLLYAASAAAGGAAHPDTFVIHASGSGREATIRIPVGAVSACSANAAEALDGYEDSEVEAMRLRGNVRIDVIGAAQPIEIQADSVILELTADEKPVKPISTAALRAPAPREHAMAQAPSARVIIVETTAGPIQITADRVEHMAGAAADI